MAIIPNIEEQALKDGMQTNEQLEQKLHELKAMNWRILECIAYVRVNQNCSLMEAKHIVANSGAWIDQKETFEKHQEEMNTEFLKHVAATADMVEQVITKDGVTFRIIKK